MVVSADRRIQKIFDGVDRSKEVLVVGCAQNPEIFYEIAKRSGRTVGIDVNEVGLAVMSAAGFDVRKMDAQNLELDDKFNYIIAGEVLDHLSNPGLFLEGAKQVLAKGGQLVITVPNISSLTLYLAVLFFDQAQDKEHVTYFDLKSLEALSARHGWRLLQSEYLPPSVKSLGRPLLQKFLFLTTTILTNIGFLLFRKSFGTYIYLVLEKEG